MTDPENDDDAIHLPINGVIDLHTFHPSEAKAVVLAFIEACQEDGIEEIRIIHGKGKGVLRTQIHALLERHQDVLSYSLAPQSGGGWGATVAQIRIP